MQIDLIWYKFILIDKIQITVKTRYNEMVGRYPIYSLYRVFVESSKKYFVAILFNLNEKNIFKA